jgi:microcystin-dependent protein
MSKLSAKIGNIIKNPTPASPHQAGVVLPFAGIFAPNGWAMCQGQEISKTIYTDLFSALSFSQTVTTSNTSTNVTTSSTGNLNVGTGVSGTGIPSGAYVASITNSTTFVLSSAATASGSVTAVFALYDRQVNPTTGSAWAAPTSGFFRVPDLRGVFLRGAGTASGQAAVAVGGYQAQTTAKNGLALSENAHTHLQNIPNGTFGIGSYVGANAGPLTNNSIGNAAIPTAGATTGISLGSGDAETRPLNRGVTYIIKLWNDTTYGIAVGVADHQKGVTSGLVPVNGLSARNVIGDTTAVPAGCVGETVSAIRDQSGDTTLTGNAWVHHSSDFVTLSPGIWILYGAEYIYSSSTTDSLYGTEVNIGTVTGNNSTGFSTGHRGNAKVIGPSAAYQRHTVHTVPRVVSVAATTSYFIKIYVVSSTGGSWFTNGATLIAVRIA